MAKLFVICSLVIALIVVVCGQRLDELYLAKYRVSTYLTEVKNQLDELASTASKQNMDALIIACNIVRNDNQIGYSQQQVDKLRDTVQTQLDYLKQHETELILKTAMLDKSLTNLNNQIITVYQNVSQTNKLAPTTNGMMMLTKNGDVMYQGYYHSITIGQGFTDPSFADSSTITTPHIISYSGMPNATVITEIFPGAEWGFFLKTSTGDIYSNGYFTSNTHGVGVDGLTVVYPMRKVDFQPSVSVKKVVCRAGPICIFWGKDGKLYYTGRLNVYSGVTTVPAVINRPTALPVIYNNTELTVFDFSLTHEGTSICIIAAEDFKIYCMGYNGNGQLGDETGTSRITWAPISSSLTFTQVRGGSNMYFAVSTDGRVYNWGLNADCALRVRDVLNPNTKPTVLPGIPSKVFVKNLMLISSYCTATVPDNMVIIDQNDNAYMLGAYNGVTYTAPYQPESLRGKQFKEGAAFISNQYIRFTDETMLVSGTNTYGILRISNGNAVIPLWRETVFSDVF